MVYVYIRLVTDRRTLAEREINSYTMTLLDNGVLRDLGVVFR